MLASHTESFLKLINSTLDDISHGVDSPHHLHNVRCGVENIMCLLEYNNEVVQKAEQLSRQACDYTRTTISSHRKTVTGRLSKTLTAWALFARRLPVFALR
jgi:hypothetical protein